MEKDRAHQPELLHHYLLAAPASCWVPQRSAMAAIPKQLGVKGGGKSSHGQIGLQVNTPNETPGSAISPSH